MNPLIPLFLSLAETLIQDEPEIVAQVQALFAKSNPTPADRLALHQQVLAKTYADYVPASALASTVAAASTASVTTVAAAPSPAPETAVVATPPPASNAPVAAPSASEPAYLANGTANPIYTGP